jgi:hypothetical protein
MKWILGQMFLGLSQVNERLIAKTITIIVGLIGNKVLKSYEEIPRNKGLNIFRKTNTIEK